MKTHLSRSVAGCFLGRFEPSGTSRGLISLLLLCVGLNANAQRLETLGIPGVKRPVVSLNGTWKFRPNTSAEDPEASLVARGADIQVPGEVEMQGWDVAFDRPFLYFREAAVPKDFAGKWILLRFDGVYSYARLWVNDRFIRDHHGGFTRWEADVTGVVTPGEACRIRLEVTDRADDISWGSTYAHHQIGGILRDVTLYALPQECVTSLKIHTDFDAGYEDARLEVAGNIHVDQPGSLSFMLLDPSGAKVPLPSHELPVTAGQTNIQWSTQLAKPLKWEAERPQLYTLHCEFRRGSSKLYSFSERIGFRKIEVRGNQLLVNGHTVKLRGTCRQEVHPLLGRTSTEEYARKDVRLAREANINFIRTSHYPPSEEFLRLCDEYGIFVESESAVCFVDRTYQPVETENNPAYTERYLSQLEEMVASHRNHPSVILWSIANESNYGTNLLKSYQWLREHEPTRPVMFSWPKTMPEGVRCYDVLSSHYPNLDGTSASFEVPLKQFCSGEMPVIFDEWVHLPCYIFHTLQEDPGIREFWGQSLDKMWTAVFDSPAAGGAIWCMIDDTFMLPRTFTLSEADKRLCKENVGPCVGYGQWGLADPWRRKKPEFWSVKKAYSPVRLLETRLAAFEPRRPLELPIHNRFDVTDLKEIQVRWSYQGRQHRCPGPALAPHARGVLSLEPCDWRAGGGIDIAFYGRDAELIDQERVILGAPVRVTTQPAATSKSRLVVAESEDLFTVTGEGFVIPIDKKTGLIRQASSLHSVVVESGPFVNFITSDGKANQDGNLIPASINAKDWRFGKLSRSGQAENTVLEVEGDYGGIAAHYTYRFRGDGMTIDYSVGAPTNAFLHEAGLTFRVGNALDTVRWDRESYWSVYPPGHLGAPEGRAAFNSPVGRAVYRAAPKAEWSHDPVDYFLFGDSGAPIRKALAPLARALKQNVRSYSLTPSRGGGVLEVVSPECNLACRVNRTADDGLILHVNQQWDYPELGWGNYTKRIKPTPIGGTIRLRLGKPER